MRKLLPVILLANASTVLAASTLLEVPVTYHPNADVVPKVKEECQIENLLANRVGAMMAKINKTGNGTTPAGVELPDSALLRLQITHVLGVGGGAWSGPKAITVTAELLENGKLMRQTKINRWSVGGVWGAFRGTCSILDRSAIAIAKDMARWVRNPGYQIVEQPAPVEAVETKPVDESSAEAAALPEAQPAPAAEQ